MATKSKVFFGPGDWLGSCFSARERRALATWALILITVTIPVRFLWKDAVWMVWAISEVALVLALAGVVSAETPVESED